MQKRADGLYQSTLLLTVPNLVHGYSSRAIGDARTRAGKDTVLKLLGIESQKLFEPDQVHGNEVAVLDDVGLGVHAGVDGLIHKVNASPVTLSVHVADCVALLLVDPVSRLIGAIHAGWKGTLGGITTNSIREMVKLGSNPSDVIVSIGPHIGMCHYDVPEERAQKFLNAFDNNPKVASFYEGAWHVDIGWANYRQLLDNGIRKEHIDAPLTCTACQIDTYFSFRKDTKETFGEIMGVIGFKNL